MSKVSPSNLLFDIQQRHERMSRLLTSTPGVSLGPMDSDRAHADRAWLLGVLERINTLACYASEENTDSREAVLLEIGKLARGDAAPESRDG
jgi:hypothetical protein